MATSMMTTRETALIETAAIGMMTEGTPDNDTLMGGADDDFLSGLGGNDMLSGLMGNDTLSGGTGDDRLDGGAGDDNAFGGGGADTIVAGDGNDLLLGGTGDDRLAGGAGLDTVSYRGSLTTGVMVNLTENMASGAYGTDRLSSIENIIANEGNDMLDGSRLRNVIDGLGGDDAINGLAGRDDLMGGAGDDSLDGGVGRDTLNGGAGSDALLGGADADQFVFVEPTSNDNADSVGDFEVGIDKLVFDLTPAQSEGIGIGLATVNGETVVTITSAGDTVFEVAVTATGGRIMADDILFV